MQQPQTPVYVRSLLDDYSIEVVDIINDVDPKASSNRGITRSCLPGITESIMSDQGLKFELDYPILVKYGDASSQFKYYVLEGAHRLETVRCLLSGKGLTPDLHERFKASRYTDLKLSLQRGITVKVLTETNISEQTALLLGSFLKLASKDQNHYYVPPQGGGCYSA